eukprot:CAMPEP_0183324006 /NCGR_PEP_ID=MMETSP0160_2-20130417/75889_1 /TAXON_ID=2839 ORGANISM="Odontella Sinensis, Strain Grunow 1884" /NCGR_SAMPLE_ID=MMETSP0160_2 /ASSEMBLY_ACC=CAM_ASM_000250 /LENGTH=60 /DNA_ID=CAMNT_0025491495 /DNA_START=107 /DNA_END=289 /DNA_ORIENTATION=+
MKTYGGNMDKGKDVPEAVMWVLGLCNALTVIAVVAFRRDVKSTKEEIAKLEKSKYNFKSL